MIRLFLVIICTQLSCAHASIKDNPLNTVEDFKKLPLFDATQGANFKEIQSLLPQEEFDVPDQDTLAERSREEYKNSEVEIGINEITKDDEGLEKTREAILLEAKELKDIRDSEAQEQIDSQEGELLKCDNASNCLKAEEVINDELSNVLSNYALINEIAQDGKKQVIGITDVDDTKLDDLAKRVKIFAGAHRGCKKARNRNCCETDKITWQKLGIIDCSADQKETMELFHKGRCHFYVQHKKTKHFCCFPSKLAKSFNVQARKQLGISWLDQGNGWSSSCRGVKPDEISRLDISSMDLSDIYDDINARFKTNDLGLFKQQITNQVNKTLQETIEKKDYFEEVQQSMEYNYGGQL